jgi:hypothetical protein
MLENHDKVILKTIDGQTIVRYFPDPSDHDLEVGATLCPNDPHFGSALHTEGYIRWGDGLIAKQDNDGFGMVILDINRIF